MTQPKLILLAEDNVDNRDLVRWTLELSELPVALVEAQNGEELLQLLGDHRPSLILMDMAMPVLDGWETTKRVRAMQEFATVPIFALTGSVRDEDKKKILEMGCNEFVPKPIDTDELIQLIQKYLSQT